jgi:phenylacetate-CoA ligase
MKNKVTTISKNPERLLQDLRTKPEQYWIRRGEKMALRLFRQMAERVPAYKDFLRKNKVDPKKIKTIKDFKSVPTVDKNNYLRRYPLEKLCWDGRFNERQWVFATTSGSTGKPFYFPREDRQDWQYTLTAELYLRTNFEIGVCT